MLTIICWLMRNEEDKHINWAPPQTKFRYQIIRQKIYLHEIQYFYDQVTQWILKTVTFYQITIYVIVMIIIIVNEMLIK